MVALRDMVGLLVGLGKRDQLLIPGWNAKVMG
jgi:hypothetical protein